MVEECGGGGKGWLLAESKPGWRRLVAQAIVNRRGRRGERKRRKEKEKGKERERRVGVLAALSGCHRNSTRGWLTQWWLEAEREARLMGGEREKARERRGSVHNQRGLKPRCTIVL